MLPSRWTIVAAAVVIIGFGSGALFSLAVFLKPMQDPMGWSRAGISGVALWMWVAYGIGSLMWGVLADRWGVRRVVIAGGVLLGLGLVAASRITSLWQLYAAFGGLVGVAAGAFYAPLTSAATRWFAANRGLAVALVSAGTGLGTFVVAPLTRWLISSYDWRLAMLIPEHPLGAHVEDLDDPLRVRGDARGAARGARAGALGRLGGQGLAPAWPPFLAKSRGRDSIHRVDERATVTAVTILEGDGALAVEIKHARDSDTSVLRLDQPPSLRRVADVLLAHLGRSITRSATSTSLASTAASFATTPVSSSTAATLVASGSRLSGASRASVLASRPR